MKVLKRIFDFYINSSIHVALSVFSLAWITLLEFELPYDKNVLFFIFFASITGYNFVKFFGLAKFHHRSLATWLKYIQLFSLVCFLLMCYYVLQLEQTTLVYISVFGVVTFLYAIPFLPKKIFLDEKQNLRSLSGLKVYVIALVWCGVTVFLPLANADFLMNWDVSITAIQRFVFVLVLMLPFEIRDLQYDSVKLATIPQQIGVKKTKVIGVLLLMVLFFLDYLKDDMQLMNLLVLLVVTAITLLSVVLAKKEQSKYYSAFFVEGIPVLWLLLVLVFQLLT
ncbi:hypothetical protein DMZ43_10500 [Meridianimaribacter sp. CL38]|uniref:hypothetical protein n=1 Tax=Meridianimaribacter sp. CL38 TaxID=2213021 RepID=UPI00103F6647|nr:hypothetical protein [Meridianimaribacter sp. CL38]TBV25371.1 hypothetical protein DMZ43_10500 [Meridianimaribacter sp. CL38]